MIFLDLLQHLLGYVIIWGCRIWISNYISEYCGLELLIHNPGTCFWWQSPCIDGLVKGCSNSIAKALELLQSCTKPSMSSFSYLSLNMSDDTVWCHYNIIFLENTHNWHPIAHPLGWAMGCLLWVQIMIYVMPQWLKCCMKYCVTLGSSYGDIIWLSFWKILAIDTP